MAQLGLGTRCVQAGYSPKNGEPRQIPIIQSTTFKYESSAEMGRLFDLEASGYFYSRLQNPTNDAVAARIAALEGGTAAMLTASGQAAIFFAVFNIVGAGDHLVSSSSIYGGSFNPPHLGHIFAARKARQLLGLDKILLIPAAIPPHKAVAEGSPDGETRFALTQLAIAGETGMEVSRIELDRPGPSYTVDTLRKLRECYPQDELYLLMGTDMFLSFFQWREPETIAKLAVPVCMARVRADSTLSEQLLAQRAKMKAAFGVRPIVLQNDCLEISSTEARRLLFFGIADEVLHPDVLAMIERERLYGVGGAYHALPFADLRRVSLSLHKEKRRAHAQGVSDTAVLLAKKYGADETDAARAGILHDITKALSPAQQQKLVDHWKLPVSPFEYAQAKLLHAKTGAAAAARIFGENNAVVSAIDYHTTGRAHMTLLEKIIYIADYMEPNRDFPGVDRLREAVWRDLDEGVLLGIDMTLEQLAQKGQPACADSLAARDWLIQTRKEP